MTGSWINWAAIGKILGVGLLAGAGLPALFAIGLRFLTSAAEPVTGGVLDSVPGGKARRDGGGVAAAGRVAGAPTSSPIALFAGCLCFAVVLAAIGYGIYIIVEG
jgi:hypothetical protein